MKFIRKIYDWMGTKVHSSHAEVWLVALFFIESSFFIIPVDPLLILFCIQNNRRSFYYAMIATVSSVLGGLFGYAIGSLMWDSVGIKLVNWLISEATFNNIVEKYKLYQNWVVLVAGFTPVPYKAITLSAGFCKLPIIPFVIYSFIGRGARFFLVAGAICLWGGYIKIFIDRYFNYLVVAFTIILVLSCNVLRGAEMIELTMPELKKVEALAQSTEGCISFSQGALRLGGVDADIKEYARQMLLTDKADYYQDALGILPLRKKLAETLSEQFHVNVGIENVLMSHGGVGALTALCLGLLKADDEVILLEPTYPVYKNIIAFSKAKSVIVPAFTMEQDTSENYHWQFHPELIEAAFNDRTRMIIIANPSNPCGSRLSKQELITLKRLCESRGIYVVVDEVYDDYVFEGDFYSSTPLALQSDFVIRVGSFSKSFAMSGWRLGYLIGSARLVAALAPLQAGTLGCPTVISQYAGMYALEHKKEIIAKYFDKVKRSRDIACTFFDRLQKQGLITYVKPTAGFYVFFKTQEQDSIPLVMDILKSVKVAMAPGKDFGPHVHSYVRFCFARDPEVVTEGLKRLQEYYSLKYFSQSVKTMQGAL